MIEYIIMLLCNVISLIVILHAISTHHIVPSQSPLFDPNIPIIYTCIYIYTSMCARVCVCGCVYVYCLQLPCPNQPVPRL